MEIIAAFNSTSQAVKAEKVIKSASISVGVMALPGEIRAGCGLCLRIADGDLDKARDVFANSNISGVEFYVKGQGGYVKM